MEWEQNVQKQNFVSVNQEIKKKNSTETKQLYLYSGTRGNSGSLIEMKTHKQESK